MKTSEDMALSYIPPALSESVRRTMALYKGKVSEIRMRTGAPVYITADNKNISCNIGATYSEIQWTVRSLCGNSMYSHSETIREGYICTEGGLRAGVCGRAVTERNNILSIADISSVCIRIPHRIKGAESNIIRLILNDRSGMIFYSKPGVGKTTMLREISATLASPPFNFRVAVVDTRFEICGALNGSFSIDILGGYPRAKGIETALRTLSPEFIICDEIGNSDDAEAIVNAAGAGVPIIASAHAGSFEELIKKRHMKELIENNTFKWVVELSRIGPDLNCAVYSELGELTAC